MNRKKSTMPLVFTFITLILWWTRMLTIWASKLLLQAITALEKLAKYPPHITLLKLLATSFWVVFITFISCLLVKKITLHAKSSYQIKNPLSKTK